MSISPKDFLKQRRPNKFSDSRIVEKPSISRPVLEMHLVQLTSRNEHDLFESFARRLCEIEICPNLKPNTGPAGGGDGKTDADSYPVSRDTALGWYVGYETAGKNEKLALAISAKKDWRPKLKNDLKSIEETKQKITRVYFATNQYVEASSRKKLEKELSEQYAFDVHIMDLTWILEKVFNNNRLELAVKALNIEVDTPKIVEDGPIDIVRQRKITELDNVIEDTVSRSKVDFVTVRNAIDAAVYSREQELPRVEVAGRLDRAVRLADNHGTTKQRFLTRYQKSWTDFWYFEDFQAVKDLYNDAQKHALLSGSIDDLEKLSNLRLNLSTIRRRIDKKLVSKAFLDNKTSKLLNGLQKIADNKTSPSAALYAQALIELIKMQENIMQKAPVDKNLKAFKAIIAKSEGHPGFPFQSFTKIILMMEDVIGHSNQYDSLFETIQEITRKRDGEKSSALMILDRARNLLDKKQNYKAIQVLGSVLAYLHKEETLEEATEALCLMGDAYKRVDLLWAARGSYLNAASLETARFFKEDEISIMQLRIYDALIEMEIRLGRMPQILQWYEVIAHFCNILPESEWRKEEVNKEFLMMPDLIIGSVLLAMPGIDKNIAKLINPLEKLGLEHSTIAAAYRINREDLWPDEFKSIVPEPERKEYFEGWVRKIPRAYMPTTANYYDGEEVRLISNLLGCEITIHSPNSDLLIMTGESILASIESLLSTAPLHNSACREPRLNIYLELDLSLSGIQLKPSVDSINAEIRVHVSNFNPHVIAEPGQQIITDSIIEIIASIISLIVSFEAPGKALDDILGSEKASGRSVNFTLSYIRLGNTIGHNPKYQLSDWSPDSEKVISLGSKPNLAIKPEENDPVSSKQVEQEIGHKHIKTASIIRSSLWESVGWRGVYYAFAPKLDSPAYLALCFVDSVIGEKIFSQWHEQLGSIDAKEIIRLAIMRDIDAEYPHDYRLSVSANLKNLDPKASLVSSMSRIHTMNPENSHNLDNFLQQYQERREYVFTFATIDQGKATPNIRYDLGITKKELIVKTPKDIQNDDDIDKVLLGKART